MERVLGAVAEDGLELVRVVRREVNLPVAERRLRPRIELVFKSSGCQSIQVSGNVIECRNSTEWAVEERPMSGPTVIVHNLVENAGNRPYKTDHRDTVVRENVSV